MRTRKLSLLFLLAIFLVQSLGLPRDNALAQTSQHLDLVIVIDNSGSMDGNDPRGLRYSSAYMLLDLLSDKDRVAIVNFSDRANKVTPEFTLLTAGTRNEIKQNLEIARRNDPRNSTNYGLALDAAHSFFVDSSGNQQAVIFLTDGLPTDMRADSSSNSVDVAKLSAALAPFEQGHIPVFLMVLKDQSNYSAIRGSIAIVAGEFEQTGPSTLEINDPVDIVRAFAFVITQLLPDTYLDPMEGYAEGANTTRFKAQASANQFISRASFVFVPPNSTPNFNVSDLSTPSNVRSEASSLIDPNYSLSSFVSSNNQPIDGEWTFSAASNRVVGFAFIQSDIELNLIYPSVTQALGQRVAISNQPLLLGAQLEGLSANPDYTVEARFHTENCFDASIVSDVRPTYSFNLPGLSPDNTVYWSLVSSQATPTYVDVVLRQLDQPIRLSRCFSIQSAPEISSGIQIIKPTATDALLNGGIPLELNLPGDISWISLKAFVQSPSGSVEEVVLDLASAAGIAQNIDAPGMYKIRYLLQGLNAQNQSVTLFTETSYLISDVASIDNTLINLGTITSLNTVFSGQIQVSIPFITLETPVSLSVVSTKRVADGTDVSGLVTTQLCVQPQVSAGGVTCDFTVSPSNNLSQGEYEITVQVSTPEQELRSNTVLLKFEHPGSILSLPNATIMMGYITPDTPVLRQTLNFNAVLWQGDPLLPESLMVNELWQTDSPQRIPGNGVSVQLRRNSTAGDYTYDVILTPDSNLPAGSYEAKVALNSSIATLNISPSELLLQFSKPLASVSVTFGNKDPGYKHPVWGYPLPKLLSFLFPTVSYLPATATTQNMVGDPILSAPTIVQIMKGDEPFDPSSISFKWRNDGLAETGNQYKVNLVAQLVKPLPEGDYDIRVRTASPIVEPFEQVIHLQVYGWNAFFLQRFLPFICILLVTWIVYRKLIYDQAARFNGVLVIDDLKFDLSEFKNCQTLGFAKVNGKPTLVPNGSKSKVMIVCKSRNEIELRGVRASASLKRGESKVGRGHRISYQ